MEEEFEEQEEYYEDEGTLSAAISSQLGQSPWYVGSIGVHAIIFLILLLIPVAVRPPTERRIIIQTEFVEDPPEEPIDDPIVDIKEKDPIIEKIDKVKIDEVVVKTTNIEISDTFETDDNMDRNDALGEPDNISDVDSEFKGTPAFMGVGNTGGGGGGGKFGSRIGGGKRNRIKDGGGDRRTESSVNWALKWLAAHQEYDGRWDCAKYGGSRHGGDDVAVTSMAVLAFLGSGNTTRFGKYRTNVKKAVKWLIDQQNPNGSGGPHRYTSGIYLMALAEAYGMSDDAKIRKAAQKAADWAVKSQCPTGGWDYKPSNGDRVDTSVTGWWIMGIKSAKVAYLDIPEKTYTDALKYIKKATDNTSGSVSYATKGGGVATGGGSTRMTAVALTCLQFLGVDKKDQRVQACATKSIKKVPDGAQLDFYEWYYQALGFFQTGIKSDYWKRFNDPMKTALLSTQVMEGTVEQNKGSWNPDTDKYGPSWGRVGQTALGALMLEVYYRYDEVKPKK